MIISTIDLFCYYNIPGADEEMLFGFKNLDHPTRVEPKLNTALHSFSVSKDCFRIFYDQWVDSGVVQKKFLDKVVVPEIPDLPDNCKHFHYDSMGEIANYIQQLTGKKFNPKCGELIKYKKNNVMLDIKPAILKKFKEYNTKLGYEYE
tara:strand:+ start:588 stop:1031 length:444 start_codon:yes stop_codon:yes gene_type:complete